MSPLSSINLSLFNFLPSHPSNRAIININIVIMNPFNWQKDISSNRHKEFILSTSSHVKAYFFLVDSISLISSSILTFLPCHVSFYPRAHKTSTFHVARGKRTHKISVDGYALSFSAADVNINKAELISIFFLSHDTRENKLDYENKCDVVDAFDSGGGIIAMKMQIFD